MSIDMDVHTLLREADAQKKARAEQLPTEYDCLRVMQQAFFRLRELGWNSVSYAPRDGRMFEAIELGCSKIMQCQYIGDHVFASEADDLWPVRPSLFRSAEKE